MKKFQIYHQHDSMDCGPTCLQMVAKHYGRFISVQKLREYTEIGRDGVNMLGLCAAAERVGFKAKAIRLSYSSLFSNAPLPSILYWEQQHFVVLYKITKKYIYIADPARNLMTYTPEEFKSKWLNSVRADGTAEGVALLLDPTSSFFTKDDSKLSSELKLWSIIKYIAPYKKMLVQLLIGLFISSIIQLILPFLTQGIVDKGVNLNDLSYINIILLGQLSLLLGRLFVEFTRSWILLHISSRLNLSILSDFLVKLLKLPITFFESKRTGDILQRISDHQRIESFLTGSSLSTIFSFFNLIIFSGVLLYYNTTIFIVFLTATVIYSFWAVTFLKSRRILDYKKFDVASKEQGLIIQLIQGMQDIKLNGSERQMRWSWENLQAKVLNLNAKNLSLNQWQLSGSFFINEGKNAIITYLAARAVINHDITLGSMLAVQYIIGQLNSPIEQIISFIQSWQNAKISIDRLNEIHKLDDEEQENELSADLKKILVGGRSGYLSADGDKQYLHQSFISSELKGSSLITTNQLPDIFFRNLYFTYPGAGNEPILKNINLKIPSGKITAVVGTSGSGKTTLLKLLLKFYEPNSGDIMLNNLSFNALSHSEWRKICGVVMQDSFIFNDSIAKNIAVGVDQIDIGLLQHAVDTANLNDFISKLALGLNTKIGAEGTGISEGQKQRILIARAIYKNPHLILFDEATNSLDANNETTIMENLNLFFKGRTVIVVAHRLSTIRNADQIVVLNNGSISEMGNHQNLIKLKGEYYTLIKNQLELDN